MENRKDRHKVLQDLSTELNEGFLEETYEVAGRQWTMRTLNDAAEVWSDKFIASGSLIATVSSRRAIKLAASIMAINDVPIEQLFFFAETEAGRAEKEFVLANSIRERFWYAEKMFEYLSEQPSQFIAELYMKYIELTNRQMKVMREVMEKNLLTRTPTPVSDAMLSQEKASS